jgi:uncharacterized protein (TIGR02594 family)
MVVTHPYCDPDTPWMSPAWGELFDGVRELPGKRDAARVIEYLRTCTRRRFPMRDSTPWCSAFVCWCVEQVGIESTRDPAARSWLTWGRAALPRVGAVVIFPRPPLPWSGHVGFVSHVDGGAIGVLGGNQSNAVSIVRRRRSDALGYRWPIDM